MKQKFSTAWKSSRQPRKQRKYSAKAPIHIKRKLLNMNLSKELRKKYGRRNIPVRKGDTVKVMKGKFKKKQGKIISVDVKKLKLKIDEISIKKRDGSKVNVKIHPSNLQIVELNTDDKKRKLEINKVKRQVSDRNRLKAEPLANPASKSQIKEEIKLMKKETKMEENNNEK